MNSGIRARLLCSLKVSIRVSWMELLGHSQISLTIETYSHVLPEVMRDAVARIGALLGSPSVAG